MNDFKLTVTFGCPCCSRLVTVVYDRQAGQPPRATWEPARVPFPLVTYEEAMFERADPELEPAGLASNG